MNPLTSALVSRASSAIAVLRPSRELVAGSQRCSTFAASSPIRSNCSSNSVSFSRRARSRDLLGGNLGGLRQPEAFRQLLVEAG
jgi:hypothetical protein